MYLYGCAGYDTGSATPRVVLSIDDGETLDVVGYDLCGVVHVVLLVIFYNSVGRRAIDVETWCSGVDGVDDSLSQRFTLRCSGVSSHEVDSGDALMFGRPTLEA